MSDPRDGGLTLPATVTNLKGASKVCDPRDDLAALIAALDGREPPRQIDFRKADAILAAGWLKPKPPTVYPDHDIDVERAPYCNVCGRDIQWDDNTESWTH